MRALHVVPALAARYGGPSLAAVGMARALLASGVEVVLAATNADGPKDLPVPLGDETSFEGVPAIFFDRKGSEAFKYAPGLSAWLRAHVHTFDVVHVHGIFSHACLAAAAAARNAGVPYVVRPLGNLSSWSMNRKPIRKRIAWHLGVRQMLERAAAIHYTSEAERLDVESSRGLSRGVVIPHGIEINDRRRDGSGAPYVLFLSRIHPKKRLELLIDAFIEVTREEPLRNWRLVIAGDGEPRYVKQLLDIIYRARVQDRVLFTGWVDGDEKAQVLREASLFALTSSHENFGICVAEAMAAHTPVLVSEHVDLSHDVRRGDAGWVTSLDPSDVRRHLRDALLHDTVRHKRGANGRRLIEREFTWARVAGKLTSLYAGLPSAGTVAARTDHLPAVKAA
ncbi:MAG: glycosyltransferase [Rhodothermales bacterium]